MASLTVSLGTVAIAAPARATSVPSPSIAARPGYQVPLTYDAAATSVTEIPALGHADPDGFHAQSTNSTFIVNYDAGFNANPSAKNAFQYAVDQWANAISSPVPIVVNASFTNLGSGVLGSAGPTTIYRDFPGATQAGTWYASALANALYGDDIDPASADIGANFSSGFAGFYFGTDGNTAGKVDFVSVVLHELGHGLGFIGAMDASGSTGTCCLAGYPLIYDRYTASNGTALLSITNNTATLGNALRGQDVRFDGPQAKNQNGGVAPKLYAPASWSSGSSYSHLDEATYPAGNANSLMTPAIGSNEVIHNPGPITLGIFKDSGWVVGSLPKLSIGSARVVEGNSSTRKVRFNVALSEPVTWPVSASFATTNATAIAGSDYTARNGTVTIPAGETSAAIAIDVKGDTVGEAAEKFKISLGSPSGAVKGTASNYGYILSDDPSTGTAVSIGSATVPEGNSGDRVIALTITLSRKNATPVTVDYASAGGTALDGVDYEDVSGTYTFAANATYGRILITIHPDTTDESTETFAVNLSNAVGATIQRASGSVSVSDDD